MADGKPGRKRLLPEQRRKKVCVCMTDAQAKLLRKWGKGNLSAGLQWLIERAAPLVRKPDDLHSNG